MQIQRNEAEFNRVAVVGLGYIGLPTATMFASCGIDVIGIDVRASVVETVNQGKAHIVEPDLDELVKSVVASGRLRATTRPEPADAFIIAVGTPCRGNHIPDITYVEEASRAIAPVLQKGNLVILESTSPVGTTERVADILAERRPDLSFPQQRGARADVQVAHCPERVLPGRILIELVENHRVLGGMTHRCAERAIALYQTFVRGKCVGTDARTAEMAKLTENSFRDVNIAFANELSLICDRLDIDVWELIRVANLHPRVGILQPGPGVGGHCIAVDPWFIVHASPKEARLIRTAREVNDSKPHFVVNKVVQAAAAFRQPTIACLGLAFKADIDDLRESPSVEIVHALANKKVGQILAVEPNISELPHELAGVGVELRDARDAIKSADVVVVLVNHKSFIGLDAALLAGKSIIDTRGIWRHLQPDTAAARRAA